MINDRYYRTTALLVGLPAPGGRHPLVRVKSNLRRRLPEVHPDGSALVEILLGRGQAVGARDPGPSVRRGRRGSPRTAPLQTSMQHGVASPAAAFASRT